MTEQNSQMPVRTALRPGFDRWSVGAVVVALLVLLPIFAVLWIALTPDQNIWPHLISTTLPRYVKTTVILVFWVGLIAGVTGSLTAWMVVMYRFPGSRWLEWLLLLPLAIPAYVGAYALVDFLEYAGPVQTALRESFGWKSSRDYWFPEIRSVGAAIIVLSGALFPYVFLLAKSAFREQSGGAYEVARALGAGPVARFWRVGLPLARPAIAAGIAIVMMETISDFGVVAFFAVQTLTTGIFSTWLEGGNAAGAAQIASVVLIFVFVLVAMEKRSRGQLRFFRMSRQQRAVVALPLAGWRGWLASVLCFIPFAVGFILPFAVILSHALKNTSGWVDPGLLLALSNTFLVAGTAAVVTVVAAVFMVYGARLTGRRLPALLVPLTTIGYAAPGAILGIGLLYPMSFVDHFIADTVEITTGRDIGLLMTGSAFAIIYAYTVRFFAIAQGSVDSAFGRISPSLPMAGRALGLTAGGVLRRIHIPLIRGSLGTALLLVFVDCVKELPATLLLRPFNFNTLSTRVYEQASLEKIGDAAPAAILVIGVGLAAVLLMTRTSRGGV
ncbi:MAG: ABC transporter permease [Paracoccaceae bacterium]